MSRQHIDLNIETEYYQLQEQWIKTFEFRKDDRNIQPYDMITLYEVVKWTRTGRHLEPREVRYVFREPIFWMPEWYCIFNF